MASNVFTKNEILQKLASKGYFIDGFTLDTFFKKWKVEAIFEDEQGSEFYDKNALDLVMSNLFSITATKEEETPSEQPSQIPTSIPSEPVIPEVEEKQSIDSEFKIDDTQAAEILSNISLSDGSSLIDKIKDTTPLDININAPVIDIDTTETIPPKPEQTNPPRGILEGAMQLMGQDFVPTDTPIAENIQTDESDDFDDMSLLSESLEAQERFREYVLSELSKKNVDLTPRNNEFKLDISERTLNMIARSMAKKIAKHVSSIYSADAKSASKLEDIQEENRKLEQKTKELEEQNKKLRLLLAESNKNLNSYKPSIFGLYKKVNPSK